MANNVPWLIADWPAPPGVRALCTLRGASAGDGASSAPREFFNLGDHVGDAPAAVAANRARLQQAMGARPVFMRQVRGTQAVRLTGDAPNGMTADAAVSAVRGLACTALVADCLPVLITNAAGTVVAAAHAGWRGLADGVLEQTLQEFKALALATSALGAIDEGAHELLAWLGPCIGPRVYEVGTDVFDAFVTRDAGAAACFKPRGAGKFLADLQALARQRLAAQGVTRIFGNDGGSNWCTAEQPERFYSHRRDQAARGASGRMAACIWLA